MVTDLTQRIPLSNRDEVGQLAANFNKFVDSLHQLIAHVRHQAKDIGDEASQGLRRTKTSVQELGRQQQEIAMVATAVTEMSSATQEIANNAEQTAAAAILAIHVLDIALPQRFHQAARRFGALW